MGKTIQIMIDKRGAVTNGDVIKALFPNCYCRFGQDINDLIGDFATIVLAKCGGYVSCQIDWWNAPYERGKEDGRGDKACEFNRKYYS